MTHDELIRRSIDAAFTGKFDEAFERGVRRELADLDLIHSVSGLPETNGPYKVRSKCGEWVDRDHGIAKEPTCPQCRLIDEDEAEDEAHVLRLFLGDRA